MKRKEEKNSTKQNKQTINQSINQSNIQKQEWKRVVTKAAQWRKW
jgi:hypothetical protein